jgi:hypothetical protein
MTTIFGHPLKVLVEVDGVEVDVTHALKLKAMQITLDDVLVHDAIKKQRASTWQDFDPAGYDHLNPGDEIPVVKAAKTLADAISGNLGLPRQQVRYEHQLGSTVMTLKIDKKP